MRWYLVYVYTRIERVVRIRRIVRIVRIVRVVRICYVRYMAHISSHCAVHIQFARTVHISVRTYGVRRGLGGRRQEW